MRQLHSDFYCFFDFLDGIFLIGFPNPFTAHSRPNFLFELIFHFSLVVFLFTCGILTLIFCFFFIFWADFFKMVFSIHSKSILGLVFLFSQWKFIVRQDLSCYVFLFCRHDFCDDHVTSQPPLVHSFMQFLLNCVRDVIFRS